MEGRIHIENPRSRLLEDEENQIVNINSYHSSYVATVRTFYLFFLSRLLRRRFCFTVHHCLGDQHIWVLQLCLLYSHGEGLELMQFRIKNGHDVEDYIDAILFTVVTVVFDEICNTGV